MSKTTKLPVPSTGKSSLPLMAVGSFVESVPKVVTSIGSIVESCNNRDVRMCEIQARTTLENSKIEKDYLDKCNKWAFKSDVMHCSFQSEKISGNQIVDMAKEFAK
ncbi:MAG: hypothetical protein KIG96_03170 [Treponema sp.]|nr:hypothetical protein [Treponema sp.]